MNQLTPEQKLIIEDQSKILLVNAYAGTGKTSTLVEYCKKRKGKKILYLAYNASMAKEAVKKFEGLGVKCVTVHSLAYQEVGIKYKDRLEKNLSLKPYDLLKYFRDGDYKKVSSLMSLFNKFLTSEHTIDEIVFQNKGKVEPEVLNKLVVLWHDIFSDSNMPFEHDFYLKVYQLQKPLLNYDHILVDEAQDLNPVMFDIIIRQKTNLVFIGDSFQKIYGFRRCINALDLLKNHPNAKTLYLSHTFRCPKHVVDIANSYLNLAGAKVLFVSNKKAEQKELDFKNQICIICRTNAKVFEFAYTNKDKKLHFVGGIKNYRFDEMIDLMLVFSKNEKFKKNIRNAFYKNFRNSTEIIEYATKSKDIEIKNKINVLMRLLNAKINPFDFVRMIKDYPVKQADYIITSAHKSKGLEWDQVILEDDFLNIANELKKPKGEPIDIEEINLLYVAITRAKTKIDFTQDYILNEELVGEAKKTLQFKSKE